MSVHGICPWLLIVIVQVLAQPAVFRIHESLQMDSLCFSRTLAPPWLSSPSGVCTAAPAANFYLPLQAVFPLWSIYLCITSCCSTPLALLLFLSICRDVNCSGIYYSLKNTSVIGDLFALCHFFFFLCK